MSLFNEVKTEHESNITTAVLKLNLIDVNNIIITYKTK